MHKGYTTAPDWSVEVILRNGLYPSEEDSEGILLWKGPVDVAARNLDEYFALVDAKVPDEDMLENYKHICIIEVPYDPEALSTASETCVVRDSQYVPPEELKVCGTMYDILAETTGSIFPKKYAHAYIGDHEGLAFLGTDGKLEFLSFGDIEDIHNVHTTTLRYSGICRESQGSIQYKEVPISVDGITYYVKCKITPNTELDSSIFQIAKDNRHSSRFVFYGEESVMKVLLQLI